MNRKNGKSSVIRKVAIGLLMCFGFGIGADAALGSPLTYGLLMMSGHVQETKYERPIASAAETAEAIRGMTKRQGEDYILAQLGQGCESKGVEEPTSTIILDSNNQMSLGEYQWQIKSIQYYEKKLFDREVSRTEAIKIAIDHEAATELTRAVVFGVPGALEKNWVNCSRIMALKPQVELLAHMQ